MSFPISIQTELIKVKRSAAFWLCLIGSGVIPAIFCLSYILNPKQSLPRLKIPWEAHFTNCWQAFSAFLLPMFVILICTLILQIEFRNNTWKQVFATPQTFGNVFFSKYFVILLMVLFLFLMFNVFMIGGAILANLVNKKYSFLDHSVPWMDLLKMNLKSFVALLGIISIQYWLSLRFKNFIVPIGIGLGLLVAGLILMDWKHIFKWPYVFPLLSFASGGSQGIRSSFFQNHELNSLGYFVVFTIIGLLDMRYRKERG